MAIGKTVILVTLVTALVGCADTPENQQFWHSLGQALQGGADNLNRQAQQMRDANSGVNNTNCTTTYLGNTAQTTCTGPARRSTNCTTTYLGNTAQTSCY